MFPLLNNNHLCYSSYANQCCDCLIAEESHVAYWKLPLVNILQQYNVFSFFKFISADDEMLENFVGWWNRLRDCHMADCSLNDVPFGDNIDKDKHKVRHYKMVSHCQLLACFRNLFWSGFLIIVSLGTREMKG